MGRMYQRAQIAKRRRRFEFQNLSELNTPFVLQRRVSKAAKEIRSVSRQPACKLSQVEVCTSPTLTKEFHHAPRSENAGTSKSIP